MTHILCLGDSNTFGYLPEVAFDRTRAWPALLPGHLKDSVQVHIDAACGRVFLDPYVHESRFDGRARLALHAQKGPWSGLFLQLGSNDLLSQDMGADVLAYAMAQAIRSFCQAQTQAQVLILLPAFSHVEDPFWIGTTYAGLKGKADRFATALKNQDLPSQTQIVDTAPFLQNSPDGVHLTYQGHRDLASHLAKILPLKAI